VITKLLKTGRAVNYQITQVIISLHEDGYIYDFLLYGVGQIWCLQEGTPHSFAEINIHEVNLFGEQNKKSKKFLFAIETADGHKGLLSATPCAECLKFLKQERLTDDAKLKIFDNNVLSEIMA